MGRRPMNSFCRDCNQTVVHLPSRGYTNGNLSVMGRLAHLDAESTMLVTQTLVVVQSNPPAGHPQAGFPLHSPLFTGPITFDSQFGLPAGNLIEPNPWR